jgi:hypothetical protein
VSPSIKMIFSVRSRGDSHSVQAAIFLLSSGHFEPHQNHRRLSSLITSSPGRSRKPFIESVYRVEPFRFPFFTSSLLSHLHVEAFRER